MNVDAKKYRTVTSLLIFLTVFIGSSPHSVISACVALALMYIATPSVTIENPLVYSFLNTSIPLNNVYNPKKNNAKLPNAVIGMSAFQIPKPMTPYERIISIK